MKCPKCDQVYEDEGYFCPNCGAPNETIANPNQPQPETSAESIPAADLPLEQAAQPPAKKKSLLWLIPVVAVVLIGLAALAVFVVAPALGITIFGGRSKGDGILVGITEKSDVTDVYALKFGKSLDDYEPMLEDGDMATNNLYEFTPNGYRVVGLFGYASGYVENSPYLFYSYNDDGDIALYRNTPNPKELVPIFESDNNFFALSMDGGDVIFINESRNNSERCYVSFKGEEAEQVVKGDQCTVAASGQVIFTKEISSDGELTVKSYDIHGEKEVVLLDEEKNVRNNAYGYNDLGTRIYALIDDGDTAYLKLIDAKSGEVIAESEEYNDILSFDRAFTGEKIWFIARNDDDELELYTLGAEGETLIGSGESLLAVYDQKGENLVYIAGDEDGNQTVYVHPEMGGDDIEVMEGENLSFYMMLWKNVVLIKETDLEDMQVTLYSVNSDGSGLAELFSDADYQIDSILSPLDSSNLFIRLIDEDGLFSLYATSLGSEEGEFILEEWASFNILDISANGKTLLLSGKEESDDDLTVFTVDLAGSAQLIELDDDDLTSVSSAVFTADDQYVVYNVKTGTDYDDYEIRKVKTGGEEDVELLYEEAVLLDVEWKVMDNFDSYNYFLSPVTVY
jgi:hypothetical protein